MNAGLIRGGYHFAPFWSVLWCCSAWSPLSPLMVEAGVAMARPPQMPPTSNVRIAYPFPPTFVNLTPIVYRTGNPNGTACHGLNAASMGSWIRDFSDIYRSHVGRYPATNTARQAYHHPDRPPYSRPGVGEGIIGGLGGVPVELGQNIKTLGPGPLPKVLNSGTEEGGRGEKCGCETFEAEQYYCLPSRPLVLYKNGALGARRKN